MYILTKFSLYTFAFFRKLMFCLLESGWGQRDASKLWGVLRIVRSLVYLRDSDSMCLIKELFRKFYKLKECLWPLNNCVLILCAQSVI